MAIADKGGIRSSDYSQFGHEKTREARVCKLAPEHDGTGARQSSRAVGHAQEVANVESGRKIPAFFLSLTADRVDDGGCGGPSSRRGSPKREGLRRQDRTALEERPHWAGNGSAKSRDQISFVHLGRLFRTSGE
jgi:hypothetical protein